MIRKTERSGRIPFCSRQLALEARGQRMMFSKEKSGRDLHDHEMSSEDEHSESVQRSICSLRSELLSFLYSEKATRRKMDFGPMTRVKNLRSEISLP